MPELVQLKTSRLLLRPWVDADHEPFARMNADPDVMRHFPRTLDRAESDAIVGRIKQHFVEHGWGLWAVEAPGLAPFLGFVGLSNVRFEASFTPAVEIGWRLESGYWGQGFATEAAQAAAAFGFDTLQLDEIVAFTVPSNQASKRVMDKLGMVHDPTSDFDHPLVPEGPFRRHYFYRLRRPQVGEE